MTRKLLLNALRIGIRLINLINRYDNRNACGACVLNRFDSLRHHSVVCCDD